MTDVSKYVFHILRKNLSELFFSIAHWRKVYQLYGFHLSFKEFRRVENASTDSASGKEHLHVNDFLYQFGLSSHQIKILEEEYQQVFQVASETSSHSSGIKYKSGFILYSLVRLNKFTKIYESGFQSGRSSQILVAASNPIQNCSIISSDIRFRDIPLSLSQSNRFNFMIIKSKIDNFWLQINESFKPELWFLDSDNRYNFQLAELRAAAVKSSMIIVNNSHVSAACDDFEAEMHYHRFDFFDDNRVFTVFSKKKAL